MPPPLALALTLLLIAYLLRRDSLEEPRVSGAVWLPILWLTINGSRQVSQWLGGGTQFSAQTLAEGNPIDQLAYSSIMLAGLWVLGRRRIDVGRIIGNNLPIFLFLLYAAVSVLWSDYPMISAKRWVKAIGDPVMVLVLWSERSPVLAITAALKRSAFILIPLSVLFCKYYENLGKVYDAWGKSYYTGVTLDKNMFGYLLFVFGLYFVAALLAGRTSYQLDRKRARTDQIINVVLLVMIVWLVPIANSKTSTLALLAGTGIIFALQLSAVRRHFVPFALAALVLVVLGDALFSVKSAIVEASGRDTTFTGRTGLWETVLKEPINPLIGAGYASFWLGERLTRFWAMYPTSPPLQAHNGYLEVYLNLGLIGTLLLAALLLWGLRTAQHRAAFSLALPPSSARHERTFATFGLAYSVAYLLYNVTEATFQGLNLLFIVFLLLAYRPPAPRGAAMRAAGVAPHANVRKSSAAARLRNFR